MILTLLPFHKHAALRLALPFSLAAGSFTIWRQDPLWAGRKLAFAVFSLLMIAVLAWGLMHIFSGRAAYIHVGAALGTIMTANVWFRILPSQRKMIAAAAAGEKFDVALSAQAKLRSKHNTFMAVPVVFLMISNHFPVATYGNTYAWEVLVGLVLLGWVAAKIIREA